ncbi:hypothetical protein CTI12_AA009370 [Artemisia annua]|uniref:Replication factor A C-terminal domain-containing protein n=1 Tax=Artemisia annua TaxID=35608 RepID=A0A2U1QME1_ARTAN|nr:hypothetical protein CTI12_AA009370 [Artemisia annua]
MPKKKQSSNIEPFVRDSANKRTLHVPNMHSPHVNLHRPFGDVSDLDKHGSAEDEVQGLSHCGQKSFFGHNEYTLTQHNPCGSSRAVVNNTDCHNSFRKGKTTSSVLHSVEDATPYTLGPTTSHPVHVFQTYENTLFQMRGSNPPNIQGTYFPYTDCRQSHQLERTMHPLTSKGDPCKRKGGMPGQGIMLQAERGRGGHTEQQQRNVGGGEGNSHYANEMCYLYSDGASFDLESPVAMPEAFATQGMHYSPTPLPMNEHLSHSQNGQENDPGSISVFTMMSFTKLAIHRKEVNLNYFSGAATSSSMLQPEMPDPAVVTNVAGSSAYRAFWFGERLKSSRGSRIRYGRCCGEGKVRLQQERDPPDSIKQLFKDKHFMENIRAYNQMFSMTSFGAQIDDTINNGRGPYVFKVSGEIRHQIGALCPPDNERPKFLQLYIYDTRNEVANRLYHFGGATSGYLKPKVVEHLIQILDTHNELVALFRTARDICNENDVPDFTVRLYNVDGARQYEVPSTDILGAIVFESGPEINTEYEVIIQKKGERPQRINKLHSTYMALQFPLLFVYGQPGYTTKLTLETRGMSLSEIALLNKTYKSVIDKIIKRQNVTVMYICMTNLHFLCISLPMQFYTRQKVHDFVEALKDGAIFGPAAGGYRAILLDRHGDAIHANMDADDIHHFRPVLILGQAFRITDFECTPTDKWQRTLENPTSFSFTRPTRIDAIPAESFPDHYFHFTSYNQLPTKVWDPRDKGIKDYPVLTDYIGCYITSGEAGNIGNPTTNQSRIRKVEIQNLKVTKFLKRANKNSKKNRIPFQQIFKHKAASYKRVRFTCQATITRLNTSRGWYYTSCCVCINKVTHSDGNYKCKTHGVIPAPNYRYNFRATLTDGTGLATFIFFTPKADDFIGVNCGDLVASNKGLQRGHFPKEIEAIVGTNHTFQFHYNTTSNPGVTEFVMDEVFGITDRPKQIALNPSELDSLPKGLPAPTPELKVQTTTEGAGHDDSSKGLSTSIQTCLDVSFTCTTALPKIENVQTKGDTAVLQKEEQTPTKQGQRTLPQTQTKQETTPPQAASVAMQTRSKTEMEPNVAPKTVKHRIFTEEPSENKKKELERTQHPPSFAT